MFESADGNSENILYLNLIIHNVSEAVKARVTKKLERAVVFPNAMIVQAAQTASDLTSPKYVAQALGQVLCKKLPEKLQQKGITAQMKEVFRENKFVVLQLKILHVNPLCLAAAWADYGVGWIFESMGASTRKKFEDDYLPNLLTGLLATTIPSMLEEKISDKKIEAETKVLKAQDQSIYFFERLSQLRTALEDGRRNRNPIKTIRRKISSNSSAGSGSFRTEEEESVSSSSYTTFAI